MTKRVPTKEELRNVMLLAAVSALINEDTVLYNSVLSQFSDEELSVVQQYADSIGYDEEYAKAMPDEDFVSHYVTLIKEIVNV